MPQLLLIASGAALSITDPLREAGFSLSFLEDPQAAPEALREGRPDLVLLDTHALSSRQIGELTGLCRALALPLVLLLYPGQTEAPDPTLEADEVLLAPARPWELVFRARRALWRTQGADRPGLLKAGDLVIDLERYEVSVGGRRVLLTYMEYQLLCLLATNPGRVYTREGLLEQVWGYQFFGGTRTVDVHVRRLRSKLEDLEHSFIETVRNVGYRFRTVSSSALPPP